MFHHAFYHAINHWSTWKPRHGKSEAETETEGERVRTKSGLSLSHGRLGVVDGGCIMITKGAFPVISNNRKKVCWPGRSSARSVQVISTSACAGNRHLFIPRPPQPYSPMYLLPVQERTWKPVRESITLRYACHTCLLGRSHAPNCIRMCRITLRIPYIDLACP